MKRNVFEYKKTKYQIGYEIKYRKNVTTNYKYFILYINYTIFYSFILYFFKKYIKILFILNNVFRNFIVYDINNYF